MSESRTELLAWVNSLCQLNYTKIEQCGSGIAQCIIMDSIYRDVPLQKCKFNAKHEYEYVANFKVLQAVFDKHKVSNAIPVERLTKCKFQDNIEFLQMMKKYWDQYYPGGPYDILARRGLGSGAVTGGLVRGAGTVVADRKVATNRKPAAPAGAANSAASGPTRHGAVGNSESPEMHARLVEVTRDRDRQKELVETLEKERDFYFSKLREIEVLVQDVLDGGVLGATVPLEKFKQIQGIMYQTEEGFELPGDDSENPAQAA
ncbi:calponin homology domain-containing protein [Zopfochytrium polystomum]|nr:calponin homology domain-containing protein [Zopfochytrium polystomum]